MQFVTFNARCQYNTVDGINCFIHRAGMIFDKIARELPDIICFQEITPPILALLTPGLPAYNVHYCGRDEHMAGEGLVIALRKDSMDLITLDRFWLSPTPTVPGSRYKHQSDCPRICQVALVREKKSGKLLRVYNNHLDHKDEEARLLGMGQVLKRVSEDYAAAPLPLFITGDLNARPESAVIAEINGHTAPALVELSRDIPQTFHAFGKRNSKIDYIFATGDIACEGVCCWTDELNGIYLSDHYPVCALTQL